MKQCFVLFVLALSLIKLDAASLDGTTNIVYESNHYIFSDGDSAAGFVKLENGFTVPENSTVTFNVPCLISGGIDLRTTGTLKLEGDLYLDSSVSLSSGGYIYGGDKTIYLGEDLVIPDKTDLIFCFSSVIDGQGHNLFLGRMSQILIDSNVTLTLKNLTIKNSVNSLARPVIKCLDWYSKLILDNVVFALNDDFHFNTGQLFIYNDVIFTGTSKFSYRSVLPSYIQPHSVLYFDQNTMFDYFPSSTRNDLINLIDETSSIYLNGATLQTTDTGIRLTKGRLFLDNKITLSNKYKYSLDGLTQKDTKDFGVRAWFVAWDPNGKYLAVGGENGSTDVIVYEWDGSVLTQKDAKGFGSSAYFVAWSPDGNYLAVAGLNGVDDVIVYEWDGSTLTQKDAKDFGTVAYSVAWSPDGNYLVVGGTNGTTDLIVYEWNGFTLTQKDAKDFGNAARFVAWSPDGNYLAVGGDNGITDVIVYEWNGSMLTQKDTKSFGSYAYAVAWSPDGNYLAVGGSNGTTDVIVYEWNGSTLTQLDTKSFGSYAHSVAWSSAGNYLAVGGDNSSNDLIIYEWNGSSLTQIDSMDFGSRAYHVSWNFDDNYLAVGGRNDSTDLIVYRANYSFIKNDSTFHSSIIFGDSLKGPEYDLDINILSGARVEVAGKVWDDSAS